MTLNQTGQTFRTPRYTTVQDIGSDLVLTPDSVFEEWIPSIPEPDHKINIYRGSSIEPILTSITVELNESGKYPYQITIPYAILTALGKGKYTIAITYKNGHNYRFYIAIEKD